MNIIKAFDSISLQQLVQLQTKLSSRAASSYPTNDNIIALIAVPKYLSDLVNQFETAQKELIQMVAPYVLEESMTNAKYRNEAGLRSFILKATTFQPLDSINPDQLSRLTLLCAEVASRPHVPQEFSAFLKRHEQMFIRGICKYVQNHDNTTKRYGGRKKEEETGNLELIIETCPELLSLKMKCGFYPIHCALFDHKVSKTVPLLAKAAFDKGVKNRGYILEEVRGLNLLHFLASHSSRHKSEESEFIATFKALMTSEPPLFTRKDVLDYNLLHHAVIAKSTLTVEFLVDLCPEALFQQCRMKCSSPLSSTSSASMLPIALSHDHVSMMELLLNSAIKFDPDHESIGGLFQKNEKNIPAIQYIVNSLDRDVTWNTIKKVLAKWNKNVPIVHKVIADAPKEIDIVLVTFPHAHYQRDKHGRLPIHTALATGMNWSLPLLYLINTGNFENVAQTDPVTGLCPIGLASLEPCCDLDTIYHLARTYPEQIEETLL